MSDSLRLSRVLAAERELLFGGEDVPIYAEPPGDQAAENHRLSALFEYIHRSRESFALCLSGGGIRSASFGLGVLQGLARRDILGWFDYLSTVSGGGYIGSWLTAWIHRDGTDNVFDILNEFTGSPAAAETPQVDHLREFSNYLTPHLGLTSADTWAIVATVLRNLLVNWLVIVPMLAGSGTT